MSGAGRRATNRIDAFRSVSTGRIRPARIVGETYAGNAKYGGPEGWEPVCRMPDGKYARSTRVRQSPDGSWRIVFHASMGELTRGR